MGDVDHLTCIGCGGRYDGSSVIHSCPRCGHTLRISYRYEMIAKTISQKEISKRPDGVWKYFELLPLDSLVDIVSLGEGGTYLHRSERLSHDLGLKSLWIKNETMNPTGSFMDRGSTVLVSKAVEEGLRSIRCPTTGNLGASISAYAAKAGIECSVFIPGTFDLGKFYQVIAYGAKVEMAKDYEDALKKASIDCREALLAASEDPFLLEGEKTTGYEICEQLGWRTPDVIVVPMGSGGHISMIWKALQELREIDFLEDIGCRLIGVQIEGSAPIVDALLKGGSITNFHPKWAKIAPDIGVAQPALGDSALHALRQSGGYGTVVDYANILQCTSLLAKTEGIFAEPAAASTVAGIRRLIEEGYLSRSDEVVSIITGAGLKDPIAARRVLSKTRNLERMIYDSAERALQTRMGETKLQILNILSEGEAYGYEITKLLSQRFGRFMKVSSVYQHLDELTALGLVSRSMRRAVKGKPERQYYTITQRGKAALESLGTISRI